ncbi:hypothetical protein KKH18_14455, partial [bacterium]|nr:hypothetical protein [bacterium]
MIRAAWLMLLLAAVPALGQIQSYWGVRSGMTTVIQDNYSAYTDEEPNRYGWLLAVSRTLPLAN